MSNELKWSEKFFVRINGLKRFEVSLFPANFWQYLKFLFFRQSYYNSIKRVTIRNEKNIEVEPETVSKTFGLSGCREVKFYLLKSGEYTIECRVDEKCDGWHLGYKIKGAFN